MFERSARRPWARLARLRIHRVVARDIGRPRIGPLKFPAFDPVSIEAITNRARLVTIPRLCRGIVTRLTTKD